MHFSELNITGQEQFGTTNMSYSQLSYITLPRRRDHHSQSDIRVKPGKSIADINSDDWKSLQHSVTGLFHDKKLKKGELDVLNEKVRNVLESDIGRFICEYYQDSILKKGMIILKERVKEKTGNVLIERLATVWKEFYTAILPTLLAIFYPIQEQGLSIRKTTLVGFRDIVLLKTSIDETLRVTAKEKIPSEIAQMLLVLAGIHDSNPPSQNYLKLEPLVARLVTPYIGFNGLYRGEKLAVRRQSSATDQPKNQISRKVSRSHTFNEESKNRRPSSRDGDSSDLANSLLDVDMFHYLKAGTGDDFSTLSCR